MSDERYCRRGYWPIPKAPAKKDVLIETLLDAAFRELHHDVGPQDVEYVALRESLKKRFQKIIKP